MDAVSRRRKALLWAALGIAVGGTLLDQHVFERRQGFDASPSGRSIVLIVLDTVRRDHVSPCGADSTLTPSLSALAARGVTLCNLVVPGSWTLPVHASLFTGLPVVEHGADFSFDGERAGKIFDPELLIRPLDARFPTLAEEAIERGFRTALVSGNPILAPALGLAQGFERTSVENNFHLARIGFLWRRVRELATAREVSANQFLFVNVSLAHDPFEFPQGAIDEATGQPLRGSFRLYEGTDPRGSLAIRAETDSSGDVARRMAPIVRRAYAWGVQQADRDLGLILGQLRGAGMIDERSTIVVTSDHGEFLGENGRFDHCRSVARELVDGFAIVVAPGLTPGSRSETLLQTQDLTQLLRSALKGSDRAGSAWLEALGRRRAVAWSVSLPDPRFFHRTAGRYGRSFDIGVRSEPAAARWTADLAPASSGGEYRSEGDDDLRSAFAADAGRAMARLRTWASLRPDRLDADLRASLQAAGYL